MNRWELERKIVIKALKDPTFKKKLISRPKEALNEFLKEEKVVSSSVFDQLHIRVIEEEKDEWIVVMPFLKEGQENLSPEELENVAGGRDPWDGRSSTPGVCS
jgi:hypothetical protein